MQAKIEHRNLLLQVLWTVLTFGLYVFYWFYVTLKEMDAYLGRDDNPVLLAILFGFPPFCLYSYYKQGEVYEVLTKGAMNRWIIFILWLVFPPAVWLIIQNKLNELANQPIQPV